MEGREHADLSAIAFAQQLGMGFVYPNAPIPVRPYLRRVSHPVPGLDNLEHTGLDDERKADLRLAALLHDIGTIHSHLRSEWRMSRCRKKDCKPARRRFLAK